jgi:hypothetical protein
MSLKKPNINRALKRTFWNVYDNLGLIIGATTIWLLLSLTIILMPAATAALFYIAHKTTLDEPVTINDFLKAMPRFFFQSLLVFTTFCVLSLLPLANIKFYTHKFGLAGMFFAGITFWVFFFSSLASIYSFPLLTRNKGYIKTIKYSYILVFANIRFSLLLIVPLFLLIFFEAIIPFIGIGILSVFLQNAFLEIESLYNTDIKINECNRTFREIWRTWDFS